MDMKQNYGSNDENHWFSLMHLWNMRQRFITVYCYCLMCVAEPIAYPQFKYKRK